MSNRLQNNSQASAKLFWTSLDTNFMHFIGLMQPQSPERQRVSYWRWMHTVTWLLHLQSQKHIGYFDHKLCHFSSLHAIFFTLAGFQGDNWHQEWVPIDLKRSNIDQSRTSGINKGWSLLSLIYIQFYFTLQNVVSLGATKVTPNENIESINPEKRQCFFDYEHPPNYPLKAHQKYSQVEILPFSQ